MFTTHIVCKCAIRYTSPADEAQSAKETDTNAYGSSPIIAACRMCLCALFQAGCDHSNL